jgi:hypothetical protein
MLGENNAQPRRWQQANGLSAETTRRQQAAAIALTYIWREVIIMLRFAISGMNIASTKPGTGFDIQERDK